MCNDGRARFHQLDPTHTPRLPNVTLWHYKNLQSFKSPGSKQYFFGKIKLIQPDHCFSFDGISISKLFSVCCFSFSCFVPGKWRLMRMQLMLTSQPHRRLPFWNNFRFSLETWTSRHRKRGVVDNLKIDLIGCW